MLPPEADLYPPSYLKLLNFINHFFLVKIKTTFKLDKVTCYLVPSEDVRTEMIYSGNRLAVREYLFIIAEWW